jgi:hypothetical protein
LVKNSLTEISRCFWAIDSAVARRCGLGESSATLMIAEVSMILHECQVGCGTVRHRYLPL